MRKKTSHASLVEQGRDMQRGSSKNEEKGGMRRSEGAGGTRRGPTSQRSVRRCTLAPTRDDTAGRTRCVWSFD